MTSSNTKAMAILSVYSHECMRLWGYQPRWENWHTADQRIIAFANLLPACEEHGISPKRFVKLVAQQAKLEGCDPVPPHLLAGPWAASLVEKALNNQCFCVSSPPTVGDAERCAMEVKLLGDTRRLLAAIVKSVYGTGFDASWTKVFGKRSLRQVEDAEDSFPHAFCDLSKAYRSWRKVQGEHDKYLSFVLDVFERRFPGDLRPDAADLLLPR